MMNQQKTSKIGILKYLLIAPLALALVVSSNAETIIKSAKEKVLNEVSNQEKKTQQTTVKSIVIDELTVVGSENNEVPLPLPLTPPTDDATFEVVENMPVFPGGESALMSFLSKNIKYPVEAQQKAIQGRTICQFIVTKNGSIDSVKVVRSVHPSLDAEAIRVIKAMPDWTPGTQRGKKVNVRYTLPINFVLQGKSKSTTTENNDVVFLVVEEMPKYPGGDQEMFKFIGQNIKYPAKAQEAGIQGRVIIQFIINSDGSIDDKVEVIRGVDPNLDAEAIRIVKAMPKWKPGMQRGKAVRVKYTLPINFKLDGNSKAVEPLVVVDDVVKPVGFDINTINPNDIQSVNALRGASAIAKYGEKGENGVIEISMKKK